MFGLAAVNPAYYYAALAAAAVPIIIHFLFKARKQQIFFSSIEFILTSTVLKSSRIRFKELLLLLLRCAIVALMTLAFARPFLKRDVSAFGFVGRTDLVVVLDDSYSMRYREGRGTRFEAAAKRATEAVGGCRSGDRAGLVLATRPQAAARRLTPNFSTVKRFLTKLRPSSGTSVLARALDRGVVMLKSSTADHKVVFVVSDFQEATWGYVGNVLAKLPADVKIKTAHVGRDEAPNVAVLDLRSTRDTYAPGDKVDMLARVANYANDRPTEVKAILTVEGQPKAEKTLSLKPREVREVSCRFTAPDLPVLTCQMRVEPGDALPVDDVFRCVLAAGRPLRVWCIEEKVADVAYFRKTFYLETALKPTAGDEESISPVEPEVKQRSALDRSELFTVDVLVLADLEGISHRQADRVEKFVRGGGGLIVFLGPSVEESFYNLELFRHGTGVLPARLVAPVETLGRGQEYFHLDRIEMNHPIFSVFARPYSGDLTAPRFSGAFKVDVKPCPEAKVLARYDNGLPALVERELGAGRCLLCTSTAGTKWTNLPKRMVYVPLIHQMVKHVSPRRAAEQPRFLVGQGASIPRDLLVEATGIVVKGPGGREHELAVKRDEPAVFEETQEPGVYWVDALMGQSKRRVPVWQFSVALATVESDLTPAAPKRVAELSTRSATKAASLEETTNIEENEGELPPGVWRYLFIAALACMAVELFIANRGQ